MAKVPNMKNRMTLFMAALLLLTSAANAVNSRWDGEVSERIIIPSHFSIDQVKALAIRRLQIRAATQAGATIIRTQTLSESGYQDLVEIVSASEVSLSSIRQKVEVQGEVSYLNLTAHASVDLTKVEERLSYIRENDSLKKELVRIRTQYAQAINGQNDSESYPLIWEHDAVISRWLSEPEFVAISKQGQAALVRAEHFLSESVLEPLFRNSTISSEIESVEKQDGKYIVSVRITFDFDDKQINEALSTLWSTRNRETRAQPFVMIDSSEPAASGLSKSNSEALFKALSSNVIALSVSIGSHEKLIPVGYLGKDFRGDCNVTMPQRESKAYCISKILPQSDSTLNTSYFENPVTLVVPDEQVVRQAGQQATVRLVALDLSEVYPMSPGQRNK